MFAFKDVEGRAWNLDLTIGDVKRVRSLTGVDLLDAREGKILSELANDPCVTVDILYAIVKPEADSRGMTDEQFGQSLDGDSLRQAVDALVAALIDFFLRFQPPVGHVLKALWGKIESAAERGGELVRQRMEGPEVDAMIERELVKATRAIDRALGMESMS